MCFKICAQCQIIIQEFALNAWTELWFVSILCASIFFMYTLHVCLHLYCRGRKGQNSACQRYYNLLYQWFHWLHVVCKCYFAVLNWIKISGFQGLRSVYANNIGLLWTPVVVLYRELNDLRQGKQFDTLIILSDLCYTHKLMSYWPVEDKKILQWL